MLCEFITFFRVNPVAVPEGEGNFKWKPLLCAAMWGKLEVLQAFGKQKKPSWNVDSYGENILTLLLNDALHGESPDVHDKRKKCLLWLKDEMDPDLGSIVNMIGSSGSSALSLAGQFEWGGSGNEDKDQMIGWLLGKGANITHMDTGDVVAYLDRWEIKSRRIQLFLRCITSKGEPGKGDFEINILFKWMSKKDKHEKFWIRDLCESTREDNDQILK